MKRSVAVFAILWIAFLVPACLSAKRTEAKREFPYLGVTYAPITEETLSRPKLSRTIKKKIKEKLKQGQTGLYIVSVRRRTPAYKAGMRKGDILKQFNGQEIECHQDYIYWISQFEPGQKVILTIERKDKLIDLSVTLAGKPVTPEFIKGLKWVKLERQFNPQKKRLAVLTRKNPYLTFMKDLRQWGTIAQGLNPKLIPEYRKLIDSSPIIILYSPDQMEIPEEYHYLVPFDMAELAQILAQGENVIASKIENQRHLILIAAPDKESLPQAIDYFKNLNEIPLEPIIMAREEEPEKPALEQATRPEWKIGYEWSYKITLSRYPNKIWEEKEKVIGRQKFKKVPCYLVSWSLAELNKPPSATGESYYTENLNRKASYLIEKGSRHLQHELFPEIKIFDWPLEVGKNWKANYKLKYEIKKRYKTVRVRGTFEIVEKEKVKVPAGEFETFRIVLKIRRERKEVLFREWWYSPKLSLIVRKKIYRKDGCIEEYQLSAHKL